jgi:hypothetical protein
MGAATLSAVPSRDRALRARARLRGPAATLLAAALTACSPPPTASPDAATRSGAAGPGQAVGAPNGSERDPPPPGGRLDHDTARAETDRILAEVAQARNLDVTGSVHVKVIDRAGIRAFAKDSMYEHTTPDELRMFGRIQMSFGVIPAGSDPERILLDLLEDGVLGLYDPKTKTLHIGDFVSKGMLSMVVGHEIAHGLQDMHFDLTKHQEPIKHDSDAETARRFLIEGEAQAAYLSWVSGEGGLAAIEDAVLDAMGNQTLDLASTVSPHPVLARSLQLPYADGTATVARLVRKKGWGAVSELYRDLPTTSEQMLHIDKLLAREPAIGVAIDAATIAAAVPGVTEVWHDTLGEAEILAMIADVAPSLSARKIAAGWGGDRFVVFDKKTDPLAVPFVVLAIAWDSAEDAREFAETFAEYLDVHVPSAHFLDRKKDVVLVGVGVPDASRMAAVQAAAWSAVRVGKAAGPKPKPKKDPGA